MNWTIPIHWRFSRPIPSRGPAAEVAEWFGLRGFEKKSLASRGDEAPSNAGGSKRERFPRRRRGLTQTLYDHFKLTLRSGEITAVVGPSGAGKSVLLHLAAERLGDAVNLPLAQVARSRTPAVAMLKGDNLNAKLEILSRCGLADAHALITPAQSLSEGQRYRLALAMAIHAAMRRRRPTVVIADEFAASLDALTAQFLCRQVRKLVTRSRQRGQGIALLVATGRPELLDPLAPDQVILKPLNEPPRIVSMWPSRPRLGRHTRGRVCHTELTDPKTWPIEAGTIADYHALAGYHYIAGPPAAHKRVYVIRGMGVSPMCNSVEGLLAPPVAAVLVVSPPLMCVKGRNLAMGGRYLAEGRAAWRGQPARRALARLNSEMECISRVIVHPTYRGLGLAVRLVRHALATANSWMEALAVMGRVHPLFEKAGMTAYRPDGTGRRKYIYYLAATGAKYPRGKQ